MKKDPSGRNSYGLGAVKTAVYSLVATLAFMGNEYFTKSVDVPERIHVSSSPDSSYASIDSVLEQNEEAISEAPTIDNAMFKEGMTDSIDAVTAGYDGGTDYSIEATLPQTQ